MIDLQHDGLDHIVDNQLEIRVSDPLTHVLLATSKHVVHYNDVMSGHHQSVNQMTANKTGSTSHKDSEPFTIRKNFHRRVSNGSGLRSCSVKKMISYFARYNP